MTEILFARQTDVTTITNGALRFDIPQSLTGTQKTQAQTNIGLLPGTGIRIYGINDLYVNGSTGNDSNPGTLALPFKTIQACLNYIRIKADSAGSGINVHVAAGTYTESLAIQFPMIAGNYIAIIGAGSSTTILQPPVNMDGLAIIDMGTAAITGFTLRGNASGSGNALSAATQFAILDFGPDIIFDTNWVTHINVGNQSSANIQGNYSITGSATTHLSVSGGGQLNLGGAVASIPSALAFTTFADVRQNGIIYANGGWSASGSGVAGTTGQRYFNFGAKILGTGLNSLFPGNVNGSSVLYAETSGMQYPASAQSGANLILASTDVNASAWTSAPNIQQMLSQSMLVVKVTGVNFNSVADTAIPFTLPTGFTRMYLWQLNISNASHTLVTAQFGVFTATGGAGASLIASGTAITVLYTSDQTVNNMQSTAGLATLSSVAASLATPNTIYFRVTNAEGAAATADITAYIRYMA